MIVEISLIVLPTTRLYSLFFNVYSSEENKLTWYANAL